MATRATRLGTLVITRLRAGGGWLRSHPDALWTALAALLAIIYLVVLFTQSTAFWH